MRIPWQLGQRQISGTWATCRRPILRSMPPVRYMPQKETRPSRQQPGSFGFITKDNDTLSERQQPGRSGAPRPVFRQNRRDPRLDAYTVKDGRVRSRQAPNARRPRRHGVDGEGGAFVGHKVTTSQRVPRRVKHVGPRFLYTSLVRPEVAYLRHLCL